MPPKEYNVVLRGERFILFNEQLNFDAPNYFTELFGTQGSTRETFLCRDPKLFQIIEGYLSGYEIFPLPDSAIPSYMSRETISKNLLVDARFYRLSRLVDMLDPANSSQSLSPPLHPANPPQSLSPPLVSAPMDAVNAIWFNDPDPIARWKIKMRLTFSTDKNPDQSWFSGDQEAWHETEELDLAKVKYWVNTVMGTPTRHFYPAPNHWPELKNKIAWVEYIGQNERFCFVIGEVRPGERSSVVTPAMVPPMYRGWFTGLDSETKWRMKTRGPLVTKNLVGSSSPDEWYDSGEFSSDIARSWIDIVSGSQRYNIVAMPNHWPSEMEHVISWTDHINDYGHWICVVMGKVRH